MLDQRLIETVSRTFEVDKTRVNWETNSENTPGWDSVGHLNLILEVEEAFGVHFSSEEIPILTSVGRLQEALNARAAGAQA
jgi:acyl carrier protein